MWHASECEPKSFSDPNNKPLPGFQWRATRSGSALWREIDISSSAPQSGDCLCISHLQQLSGALTGPHLHLFNSDLIPASWHSRIVSHFLPHWPLWAHTDNPSPHFVHEHAETQVCIIQQKVKTADVDKWSGSTVNVVRALAYLCAYTCALRMCPCMFMHHAFTNVFRCEFVWVCTSEHKGPLRIYIVNANQGTSIRSLLACYIVLRFTLCN